MFQCTAFSCVFFFAHEHKVAGFKHCTKPGLTAMKGFCILLQVLAIFISSCEINKCVEYDS